MKIMKKSMRSALVLLALTMTPCLVWGMDTHSRAVQEANQILRRMEGNARGIKLIIKESRKILETLLFNSIEADTSKNLLQQLKAMKKEIKAFQAANLISNQQQLLTNMINRMAGIDDIRHGFKLNIPELQKKLDTLGKLRLPRLKALLEKLGKDGEEKAKRGPTEVIESIIANTQFAEDCVRQSLDLIKKLLSANYQRSTSTKLQTQLKSMKRGIKLFQKAKDIPTKQQLMRSMITCMRGIESIRKEFDLKLPQLDEWRLEESLENLEKSLIGLTGLLIEAKELLTK